jgi:uncharacterized RDD family membrane protein YckC
LNGRAPNPIATLPLERQDAPVTPDMLDGVVWRRVLAYFVDFILIGIIIGLLALVVFLPVTVISFGLLTSPMIAVVGLIPLAYHVLLIGGRHAATFGQRLFDLRVMDIGGAQPDYMQAAVQCVLFYLTLALTGFLLLFVFLNPQRRTLHDRLSGTVVVRRGRSASS